MSLVLLFNTSVPAAVGTLSSTLGSVLLTNPTRFYFPASSSHVADVSPAYDAGWGATSSALRRVLSKTRLGEAIANTPGVILPNTAGVSDPGANALIRQCVSDPLAAQTITTSDVMSCQLGMRETSNAGNIDGARVAVYVVSNDGTVVRGTLLAIGQAGTYPLEFTNVSTGRNVDVITPLTAVQNTVNVLDGDRLVVEIGAITSVGGTGSPQVQARVGDLDVDFPLDDTTSDGAGWFELSRKLVFQSVVGTSSATLGALTLSATGLSPEVGACSATLGAITLDSTGLSPEVGALTATLGDVALASTGLSPEVGTLTGTLGALTLAATGLSSEVGTLTANLGDVALAATGLAPVAAILTGTLEALILSSSGAEPVVASDSSTLDPVTLTATGAAPVVSALTGTLEEVSLSSTGLSPVVSTLSATLGASTLSALAGAPALEGTLASTLEDCALYSEGREPVEGVEERLEALTLSSTGSALAAGSLETTLEDLAFSGVCAAGALGNLSATLSDVTLASNAGAPEDVATLSGVLGGLALVGAGQAPAVGTLAKSLGDITLASIPPNSGSVEATLGDVYTMHLLQMQLSPSTNAHLTLSASGGGHVTLAASASAHITLTASASVDLILEAA